MSRRRRDYELALDILSALVVVVAGYWFAVVVMAAFG